jgi:hypothetical protein
MCRREPGCGQDPPGCSRADAVPEGEELALDAPVTSSMGSAWPLTQPPYAQVMVTDTGKIAESVAGKTIQDRS